VSQQRVDGLLIAQPRFDDWRIAFLQAQNIPFVVVGTAESATSTPGIFLDVEKGIRQGVEHLVSQGRSRLALIPPPTGLTMSAKFKTAFQIALARYPKVVGQLTEPAETFSQRSGYQATHTLLTSDQPPDGIMACHDLVALGSMAAVQDQGFEVGSDIAIVGFGDILLSEYAQPPLTSIHQPTYSMGQQACQMVIDLISGRDPGPAQTIVEPWLVVRQSSDLALWL
jgi:LacI family transcriptional regulator